MVNRQIADAESEFDASLDGTIPMRKIGELNRETESVANGRKETVLLYLIGRARRFSSATHKFHRKCLREMKKPFSRATATLPCMLDSARCSTSIAATFRSTLLRVSAPSVAYWI